MKVTVEVIACLLVLHIFVLDLVDGEKDNNKADKKGCRKDGENVGRRCKAMKDGRPRNRKSGKMASVVCRHGVRCKHFCILFT